MPELSLRNIDQITDDIRRQEISFSHLIDDLIDHVCCDVEYEMTSGLDFNAAYRNVKKKMGSERRLREVQEETLFAVDTKYRRMKTIMKISAIAGTTIFGVAALFKIQHWPGAGIMLTIGAIILAFIFMPAALSVLWKETHNMKRLIVFISGFVTGFTFITGTLFKVQHWPLAGALLILSLLSACLFFIPSLVIIRIKDDGNSKKLPAYIAGAAGAVLYAAGLLFRIQHWPSASLLMLLGILLLCFVALPFYTWISWKDEPHVSPKFIFIIIAAFLIILPGALINVNLQARYELGYFPHLEKQNMLFKALYNKNNTFLNSHKDSADFVALQDFHNKTSEIIGLITSFETKLIDSQSGNIDQSSPIVTQMGGMKVIDWNMIREPFRLLPVTFYPADGSDQRKELDKVLNEYTGYISRLIPEDEFNNLRGLTDAGAILTGEINDNTRVSLLSALHSSASLKNNIEIIESRVMQSLADKR